jgi:hypothetical protein
MPPEEKSRQQIDAQLERCGWIVQTRDRINLSVARVRGVGVCGVSQPAATGIPSAAIHFAEGILRRPGMSAASSILTG